MNRFFSVDLPGRLYPVGRLDKDSEGLIFLTNDGAFAEEVTRAAGRHEKEYEVTVNKDLTPHFLERMEKGVYIEELDKQTAACRVRKTGKRRFTIVLTQGLNRQIRRMCKTLGYEVVSLRRTRIMNVTLEGLAAGEWRKLEGEEKKALEDAAYHRRGAAGTASKRTKAAAGTTGKELSGKAGQRLAGSKTKAAAPKGSYLKNTKAAGAKSSGSKYIPKTTRNTSKQAAPKKRGDTR